MTALPEIGQAEPPGETAGIGGTGMEWSISMIARIESHRNRPPLPVAAALYHRLEAATRASDRAHERDDQQAPALLHHRNVVLAQLTAPQNGGAQ